MKLIAVDIDGTLLNSNHKITEKTRACLIKAAKMGHKLVIVSGRPTAGVYSLAKELEFDKFDGLLSNFNGGSITDYATGEVIVNHTLDRQLAMEILDKTRDMDIDIIIPNGDYIISDSYNHYLEAERKLLGLEARVIEDIRDNLDFNPNKILFGADPEVLDRYIPFLEDNFLDRTSQVRSQRFYYEIMPQGLSKGSSLLEIAKHYGIDQSDIIAFGDEMNDYSMIEIAGLGIAMGNAVDDIKKIADYVTL